MREKLHRLRRLAGMDAQVFPTLLLRGWQVFAGGAMVLFIPLWLGKVEQGYYYTFSSLLGLQIFFELGMSQVIIQLVSHDFAYIRIAGSATLEGDAIRIDRLASFVTLLRRWYGIAASLFFLIVSIGGLLFFSKKGELPISTWGGAWLLLALCAAVNLYFDASLNILQGCGEVAPVARMRLMQSVSGNILMWIALTLGTHLWAIPLVSLTAALYTGYWLRGNSVTIELLKKHTLTNESNAKINWRKDIFPFQWRIAISWISGYFIFQLFTPLAFSKLGAVEAGRLGISMAVFSALLTVGMSWINAKLPEFAAHVSRRERASLNALFNSVVKRSLGFTFISAAMIVIVVFTLTRLGITTIQRFAPLSVTICLAIATLANCFIFAA